MRCYVPFCRSTQDNVSTSEGKDTGTTFHSFPSEPNLRAAWLRALGKEDTYLPDSAVVCSQHFLSDDIYETESGVRKIGTSAIPSTVQVCMMCLDTESKMVLMSKYGLGDAYVNYTGHPLCDTGNLRQTLCLQCAQRLKNFSKLKDKSLRARSQILDLDGKHELITIRHAKMMNREKNQLKCNFVSTMLGPDHYDLHMVEHPAEDKQTQVQETERKVFETVVVKNEESNDSMSFDAYMDETNEGNDIGNANNKSVVDNQNYTISDDSIMLDTNIMDGALFQALQSNRTASSVSVANQVVRIKDQLKYHSAMYECTLCSKGFKLEHEYNEHMIMHLQYGDDACETSQVRAAATPSCDSAANLDQSSVSFLPARVAANYQKKASPAEESDTIGKSQRLLEINDGKSGNQSSGRKNETNANTDAFTNYVFKSCNISKKSNLESRKSITSGGSQNIKPHTASKDTHCQTARDIKNTRKISKTLQNETDYSSNEINVRFHNSSKNSDVTHALKKCFICDGCGKTFTYKRRLLSHINTCTLAELITCKFCPYNTKYKSDFVVHMLTHSREKLHSCKLCEYKCARKFNLQQHMHTHIGEQPYYCKLCAFKSKHKPNLVRHMRTHTGEKPYSCKFCTYRCARNSIAEHMRIHTGENYYSCQLCEYKCARNNQLVKHMRSHTGEKPYFCQLCEYKYATSRELRKHIKRAHSVDKPYSCNVCDYKCTQHSSMRLHIRSHTGEKPYSCKLCDYKTACQGNLKRHMTTHTAEKRFSCDLCEYRCAQKFQLPRHILTHTHVNSYSCKLCEFKCTQSTILRQHMRSHTGEKPFSFSCKVCEYKCSYKGNLKRHMAIHTAEKIFSCDLCGYRCAQKCQLPRHMRAHMRTHTGEKS